MDEYENIDELRLKGIENSVEVMVSLELLPNNWLWFIGDQAVFVSDYGQMVDSIHIVYN
jgi:hypothetical protein